MRRFLCVLSIAALVWGLATLVTGGFFLAIGPVRLSSRHARNPILLGLSSMALVWALAPAGQRRRGVVVELKWLVRLGIHAIASAGRLATLTATWLEAHTPTRLAPTLAGIAAILIFGLAQFRGDLIVGGSDSYGYVSQAHLWATGTLRPEQPLMRELAPQITRGALAPLGYHPAFDGKPELVPTYSPGYPMVMAVFERLGGRHAVFSVLPLLSALAIWATYLLGRQMGGAWVGVAAALLLAVSPAFLWQVVTAPMSDIPVMAWWAFALALATMPTRIVAFWSGAAAGLAILTRPNLVPLAAILAVPFLWSVIRERGLWRSGISQGPPWRPASAFAEATADRRSLGGGWLAGPQQHAAQRLLLFLSGVVPACLTVAALNTLWYGSPLQSGYGSVSALYQWAHLWPNVARYPRWLATTETPLLLFAIAAPIIVTRLAPAGPVRTRVRTIVVLSFCFVAAVFASYLFYQPFDAWWYLRFFLPAYPPMLALTAAAIVASTARFPPALRLLVPTVLIGIMAWVGAAFTRDNHVLETGYERRYETIGTYVADRLPERAVLLSMQHSGSIRYYSGRLTLRYDLMPASRLDWLIADLGERGYHPYALLDEWEVPVFMEHFKGASPLAALDWPPLARLPAGNIKIFDLANPRGSTNTHETEILK